MIKFALICADGHRFESWFQNGDAFERQAAAELISCPYCGGVRVSKAIMAPAIARRCTPPSMLLLPLAEQQSNTEMDTVRGAPEPSEVGGVVARVADVRELRESLAEQKELRAFITRLHQEIVDKAENVGARFVEEVHKIRDGIIEPRPIYGEATVAEARDLIEEGVDILPLPPLPETWN
ncbi:DUF1178 family protein [Beijerinckia mobilis]|uniref:DUF1178 family protein n=1 Tax=Beijerinckia mobilis TaxID=231434 RepID=UPI00054CF013|nr:DUF1178 family protein [Beijerinckia mobilis]